MGADASKPALYHSISKALPPADPYGIHANSDWVDKGSKAFASAADREQFIQALISLTTSNGTLDLSAHDFKLLFSRRASPGADASGSDEPDRLVATLVAIDERGVITVKLEPSADGASVSEAFQAFKRDVEVRLGELLRGVPDGAGRRERGERMAEGAPPAYADLKRG